jgi:hypothetical protein
MAGCSYLGTNLEKRLLHTSIMGKIIVTDQQLFLNDWNIVSLKKKGKNNCFYYRFNPDSAKISSNGDFNLTITGVADKYNFQSICNTIPDSLFDSLRFNIYMNNVLMDSVVKSIVFKIDKNCLIKIEGAHSLIDTTRETTPVNDLGIIKIPRY